MKPTLVLTVLAALAGTLVGAAWTTYDLGRGAGQHSGPPPVLDAHTNDPLMPPLAPAGGPQPRVAVEQAEFDFGVLEREAESRHSFVFRNEGEYPLELRQGTTSCKCTLSKLAEAPIPPGGSAEVTLEWKANTGGETFRQTAEILTNDPQRPRVVLTIRGRIQETISVAPEALVFGNLLVHEEGRAEALVLSAKYPEFELRGQRLTGPAHSDRLAIAWEPLTADELSTRQAVAGYRLRATLEPGLPVGEFKQEVVLETNLAERPEIKVPIAAMISGDISVIGPGWKELPGNRGILHLGTVTRGTEVERTLRLLVRGPARSEVRFEVAEVRPPALAVTLGEPSAVPDTAVMQTLLTIRVPADCPPVRLWGTRGDDGQLVDGSLGEVRLKTNHAQVGELTIYLRLAVGG